MSGLLTPAVRALLIANAVAYLVQVLADRLFPFTGWFGLVPAQVARGAVWQLGTYMFLHGGLFHLLFNLLALFMFGVAVEAHLGTARFTRYYLLSGLGAGACALALGWGSPVPVVGASGAIFGLLLAFAVFFPHRRITLLVFFVLPVTLPARVFVLLFGAIEVLTLAQSGGRGLGALAHLGGLAAGWLQLKGPAIPPALAGLLRRRRAARRSRAWDRLDAERDRLQGEVDRLLAKISREGMTGLSETERRHLVEAAERLKRL